MFKIAGGHLSDTILPVEPTPLLVMSVIAPDGSVIALGWLSDTSSIKRTDSKLY